jgi:hypothetical protein
MHENYAFYVCGVWTSIGWFWVIAILSLNLRPHFRWGPGWKFIGTNLDSFEANWILELDPSLHLDSPNNELSWRSFLGLNQLMFPPKLCHVGLASICHFWVVDTHLKVRGPIYGSQPIGLLYFPWTLDLGSSSKVVL